MHRPDHRTMEARDLMETVGRENTNLAAFGWDWTEGERPFQLVNPRDTRSLLVGIRKDDGKWITHPVSNVDRFLTDNPPANRKEWRAVVDKWFAAVEEI